MLTLACTLSLSARASVIITYAEDPKSNNSTLSGTQVYDFNSNPLGKSSNVVWNGVGTFDQLFVKTADAYGGATDATHPNGTQYSLQGAGAPVLSSTLKLDTPSSYFGLWWSAGDAKNLLQFYSGDSLVGQFTTASLLAPLPSTYDGNPKNRSINSGEPYAFINFLGDEKTVWDRIVLTNTSSSGFESDNYTSRTAAWNPLTDGALPGVPVAIVSGKETQLVTAQALEGTRWSLDQTSVAAVPGAPLPPWPMLAAFAAVFALRQAKGRRQLVLS